MRVQLHVVGPGRDHTVANMWVDLDAVPQVGETVSLPPFAQWQTVVRTVVWYPRGDPDTGTNLPFVYVVLGTARP